MHTHSLSPLSDEAVVASVLAGETAMFEILMRRHNEPAYRAARAIVRSRSEALDIVQDAYLRAFQHLEQLEIRSKFSTWFLRIVVNEALARHRRGARFEELDEIEESERLASVPAGGPEEDAFRGEVRDLLQLTIEKLPTTLRTVFLLREVQELPTADVAEVLGISQQNVKVRLHRAKAALRDNLLQRFGEQARSLYSLEAPYCDQLVTMALLLLNPKRSD
jgi:RNA polymerase sigma-70 factor (ECF subfamily)